MRNNLFDRFYAGFRNKSLGFYLVITSFTLILIFSLGVPGLDTDQGGCGNEEIEMAENTGSYDAEKSQSGKLVTNTPTREDVLFVDRENRGGVCDDRIKCSDNRISTPFCTVKRALHCLSGAMDYPENGELTGPFAPFFPNESFENFDENNKPSRWKLSGEATSTEEIAHTGENSIKISGSGKVLSSSIEVNQGFYLSRVFARSNDESVKLSIILILYDLDGKKKKSVKKEIRNVAGNWTQYATGQIEVPEGGGLLEIQIRASNNNKSVYFDQVELRKIVNKRTKILLRGGTYNETCLNVTASGRNDSKRIIISPYQDEVVLFKPDADYFCPELETMQDSTSCSSNTIFNIRKNDNITIENINFTDITRSAIVLGALENKASYVDNIKVLNSSFSSTSRACGMIVGHGVRHATFSNNKFEKATYSILLLHGLPSYGNVISNNLFKDGRNDLNKDLFIGYTYKYYPDPKDQTIVNGNYFENGHIAIDSFITNARIYQNEFHNYDLGMDLTGNHSTFENNLLENTVEGIKLRQEDGAEEPHGEVIEIKSETSFVMRASYYTTLNWPMPEGIEEARVVKASNKETCSCARSTVLCEWSQCNGYELRELSSYERISEKRAVVTVQRPFNDISIGDVVKLNPVYHDIQIKDNRFNNNTRAILLTKKQPAFLADVASFRRISIAGNTIVDTPFLPQEVVPSNPRAAIHLWKVSDGFLLQNNKIIGGTANGVAFRGFDLWPTKIEPQSITVNISNNCITPRTVEGMHGFYRKEGIPPNVNLIFIGNYYDRFFFDAGYGANNISEDGNHPNYEGDCR